MDIYQWWSVGFFNSLSQIARQKEVVKILTVELIRYTRQLCKFEQKVNKLKNKRGRKCELRKMVSNN
jgi:hypothetical protein